MGFDWAHTISSVSKFVLRDTGNNWGFKFEEL